MPAGHRASDQAQQTMSETVLQHSIVIASAPRAVYDYVTQPWRWHEWHPSSRSARAAVERLAVGDTFEEEIALQPLAPLPPTLHRQTHYRVLEAMPGERWEVEGAMRDGWLRLRYELVPDGAGTRFTRTLRYGAQGMSRLWLPLLRSRQARVSGQALDNLKSRLEAERAG
jgi:hypothetical protein